MLRVFKPSAAPRWPATRPSKTKRRQVQTPKRPTWERNHRPSRRLHRANQGTSQSNQGASYYTHANPGKTQVCFPNHLIWTQPWRFCAGLVVHRVFGKFLPSFTQSTFFIVIDNSTVPLRSSSPLKQSAPRAQASQKKCLFLWKGQTRPFLPRNPRHSYRPVWVLEPESRSVESLNSDVLLWTSNAKRGCYSTFDVHGARS